MNDPNEPVFNLANNSKSGLTYNSKSSFILELKLILSSISVDKGIRIKWVI